MTTNHIYNQRHFNLFLNHLVAFLEEISETHAPVCQALIVLDDLGKQAYLIQIYPGHYANRTLVI